MLKCAVSEFVSVSIYNEEKRISVMKFALCFDAAENKRYDQGCQTLGSGPELVRQRLRSVPLDGFGKYDAGQRVLYLHIKQILHLF